MRITLAAGSSLAWTRPVGCTAPLTGTPTSKSNIAGSTQKCRANTGPDGPIPCACTAAITSWIAGPMSCWISARGMVRRITAAGWAVVVRIWGGVSMGVSG
ncbi:MAG TPA: hypothetical protein VLI06_10345 [Solimonas sp.]|nr:hypothetical protein [Solimonas sp.]